MEVNCFQMLLIYVTFYIYHVWNVLKKSEKPNIFRTGGERVKQ